VKQCSLVGGYDFGGNYTASVCRIESGNGGNTFSGNVDKNVLVFLGFPVPCSRNLKSISFKAVKLLLNRM